jgi:hypothetical protein
MFVAPELSVVKVATNAGRAARMGAAAINDAVAGSAYGAISGAGQTDGSLGDRMLGAAKGAAAGAVAGGVLGAVGAGLRGVPASRATALAAQSARADLGGEADRLGTPAPLRTESDGGAAENLDERTSLARSGGGIAPPGESTDESVPLLSPESRKVPARVLVDAARLASEEVGRIPDDISYARTPPLFQPWVAGSKDLWPAAKGYLPIYVPPRGPSARIEDALSNPRVIQGTLDAVDSGIATGGTEVSNTQPLRAIMRDELGPYDGDESHRMLMAFVAGSSPQTTAIQNLRIATHFYTLWKNGLPLGGPMPPGLGHMATWLHQKLAELAASGRGFDPLQYPKVAPYYEHLIGNDLTPLIDSHGFRDIAMLSGDPRFLQTRYQSVPGGPTYNLRDLAIKGDFDIRDATRGMFDVKPRDNERLPIANFFNGMGQLRSITAGQATSAARIGGACRTGLCINNGTDSALGTFDNRAGYTAQQHDLPDSEAALRRFIRGQGRLLTAAGTIPLVFRALNADEGAQAPNESPSP